MPTTAVYDMSGQKVGEMELSDAVFGVEPNKAVLHEAVVHYLADRRQGTQSTKTRSEVSGGGRKPWNQKGTGHARQGSIRAPQWKHGGVALGPKPRDYSYRLNKKIRRLAIRSALSSKVKDGELRVIDKLELADIRTRDFAAALKALDAGGKALVVTAAPNENVILSARNIPGVKTAVAGSLNVYDILRYDRLVVAKDAVAAIEEVFAS